MKNHRPRPATAVAGNVLALTALAAGISQAPAVFGAEVAPHNEQVVVTNETEQQLPFSSEGSGTGQLTSADGEHVVFSTAAPLVPWDDNDTEDVYLRHVTGGVTVLVSQRRGEPGNDISTQPTISADGNEIAFITWATNLTKQRDRNGHTLDAVVAHMQTARIELVSQTTAGFQRDQNTVDAVISGNGRRVAFQTFGSFGIKDDDRREDVYVRDLRTGRTAQASVLPGSGRDVRGGVLVGDVSDDGTRVTFGNANELYVRDVAVKETTRFWKEPDSPPCQPNPTGSSGRPAISGNGRYAAFASCATDLPGEDGAATDVYRIDLTTGDIVRAHPAGDEHSYLPSLSRTGRFVGFGSDATTLVDGDDEEQPDAFWADLATGEVLRASQAADGTGGDSWSATSSVAISGNGQVLAYQSYADNLVDGDLFDEREIFAWHR